MSPPRLVCILGAESTGKTTLAQQLAAHFDCPWVPEYLRAFCDAHGRTPRRDEQALILETQHIHALAAGATASGAGARFVFCDTAPLLTAIYSDYVFGDRSLYARARSLHAHYTLTLLCAPDLGWTPDGLQRDGPQVQQPIHDLIAGELAALGTRVTQIAGSGDERLTAAIAALDAIPMMHDARTVAA